MSSYLHIENHGSYEQTPQHLVLVHGWGMHGGVWSPLLKKLSKHFYLHVVDLPGMGLSQAIEPSNLEVISQRVLEALPARADILGWSLGGLVSMQLAMMQPERIRRMVLVGSTPCFVNRVEVGMESWLHGVEAEVFSDFAAQITADYQTTLIKFLTLQCMGARDARSTVKQLRASFTERPTPTAMTLKSALRMLLENDFRNDIHQLKIPTLLIHGDRDTLAPVQAAHWMASQLPAGFLRVIAGASHAPFLSHQEQFAEALMQFLEPVTGMQ